jgi:hypothetical protein
MNELCLAAASTMGALETPPSVEELISQVSNQIVPTLRTGTAESITDLDLDYAVVDYGAVSDLARRIDRFVDSAEFFAGALEDRDYASAHGYLDGQSELMADIDAAATTSGEGECRGEAVAGRWPDISAAVYLAETVPTTLTGDFSADVETACTTNEHGFITFEELLPAADSRSSMDETLQRAEGRMRLLVADLRRIEPPEGQSAAYDEAVGQLEDAADRMAAGRRELVIELSVDASDLFDIMDLEEAATVTLERLGATCGPPSYNTLPTS